MIARSLLLALLALALAAPTAGASLGDRFIPDSETLAGVRLVVGKDNHRSLRFGPKAAKLYRKLAGQRASLECGFLTSDDGWLRIDATASSRMTLSRKRGTLRLPDRTPDLDLCAISTKSDAKTDRQCVPPSESAKQCIRVIVPLSDNARTYLDAKKRAIELFVVPTWLASLEEQGKSTLADVQKYLGPDVVELPSADASPPSGKVGYFNGEGHDFTAAALLANGERVFLSYQAKVFSTNVPDLMGPAEDAFELI